MSLWGWLKDAFGPPPVEARAEPEPTAEELLGARIEQAALAPEEALDAGFWSALDRLLEGDRARTAIELLRRCVAARPDDRRLAARLAQLLCDRLEHAAARPLLEGLLDDPAHALRTRMLLSEVAERAGDLDEARSHLDVVLAADLEFPGARARAEELREPCAAPAPAAAPTLAGLAAGDRPRLGPYRLERAIGRGATGTVYVARDEELHRLVAVKVVHPSARGSIEARLRAWQEARLAATVRHPGVVAIYDLDEDRHLVVMELCTGGSLRDRLVAGPLAPLEAIRRAAELCRALDAVHRRGVVHGDVKPANLLLRTPEGELVLGDFGLARLSEGGTEERAAAGTLAYMAPEQRLGPPGPAADVYAAGVVLAELLLGLPERREEERAALLRGEVHRQRELPSALTAPLGAAAAPLTSLLADLLSHDPTRRPTAREAASRLAETAPSVLCP